MSRTILVVAAHPDDEVLGCGGAMARHAAAGDRVHAMFLTDGVGARGDAAAERALAERSQAAMAAQDLLGAQRPRLHGFPDNRLDTVPLLDIVKAIEAVAEELKPEIVYTHHAGDLNVDHRVCHAGVLTAFRPMPGQSVRAIYAFEVCSSTEWAFAAPSSAFTPQRYLDIADHLDTKLAALDAYGMEMRPFPHVRSNDAVAALARWRGACVGMIAAEAFAVIRECE